MKSDQAPILLGVLIFVLHLPVLVALSVVVLGLVAGEHGRAASSPPSLRGEWGLLGVGRAWYRPRRDDHAASTHQARLLASRRPSTGRMARVGRERGGTPLVLDRWRPCRLRIDHGRRSAPRQPALGKHQG